MPFDQELIDSIRNYLMKSKKTVAVAESVTSGNVQAAISLAKDASMFFQGGITTYNLGQKARHLLVEPTHAMECNCVSKKVSEEMALAVSKMFSSDYGLATTGFASKVPEAGIEKLYAFLSVAKNGKILGTHKVNAKEVDVKEVQDQYTNELLRFFKKQLAPKTKK